MRVAGCGLRGAGCGVRVTGCGVRVSADMKLKVEGVRAKDKGERIKDMRRRQSVKQAGLKKTDALASALYPLYETTLPKFLLRSDWTLAARGGASMKLNSIRQD